MYEDVARAASNRPQSQGTAEEDRAISRSMTNLASTIGDLETAVRALAGRIAPLLPAGSPYDREPPPGMNKIGTAPAPVRSHLCSEIDARAYTLREMVVNVNEMVKSIEI